jgi:hypothetical protein
MLQDCIPPDVDGGLFCLSAPSMWSCTTLLLHHDQLFDCGSLVPGSVCCRTAFPQMLMAGFLPFSAIYVELYYIAAASRSAF